MPKLIGLCGYAGVGKDSIAAELKGYTPLAFASSVKSDLDPLLQRAGINLAVRADKEKVRPILVCYGDGMRKHVDPDYWVKQLAEKLPMYGDVVVTDVRYPNEAEYILEQGGSVIYVSRDEHGPANETEERTIGETVERFHRNDNFHFVYNNRTPADTAAHVLRLVGDNRRQSTVDLDACGTIDGVTPIPSYAELKDQQRPPFTLPCTDEACTVKQIEDHPLFSVTIIDGEDAKEAMEQDGHIVAEWRDRIANADDPVIFDIRDVYVTDYEGQPRVCKVYENPRPAPTYEEACYAAFCKSRREMGYVHTPKAPWYVRAWRRLFGSMDNAYDSAGW